MAVLKTSAENNSETDKEMEYSLVGATEAKEWMVSSPMVGYGFDLIWASGSTWSFLADCESSCRNWVSNLNNVISSLSRGKAPLNYSMESTVLVDGSTQLTIPSSTFSEDDQM